MVAPPAGSYLTRGGPGGHCRYPRTGVPPLTVSRQGSYKLSLTTSKQPDPCGPESCSPSSGLGRSSVGKGPETPRVPEKAGTRAQAVGTPDLPEETGPPV